MITVRKLLSLPESTRLRKILLLLRDWETGFLSGPQPDKSYFEAVLALLPPGLRPAEPRWDRRQLNQLRHGLLSHLGTPSADWDLVAPADRQWPEQLPARFPAWPYLEDLRSPFNVGSIFRTAEAFGFQGVLLSPDCPDPGQGRAAKSAMGTEQLIPWQSLDLAGLSTFALENRLPIFALELGGQPLSEFKFPQNGICLLGNEELGLSPEALDLAEKSAGRVTIPLFGQKASLNVGVAWGILAEAWSRSLLKP